MPHPDVPEIKRCAIYTRKSTDHLLDRDVNSLAAQREICSGYVTSQRHKGWVELPTHYDDGGQPGLDVQRPALSALMKDIEAGLVDVIVLYKVDRLTRSLADFVRMMEVFDRYAVTFVSTSQSFDTSESIGRMILNILLTFSQFERELIAERVRDNVRLRQRHGLWPGGMPPFGYNLTHNGLEVHEEEAQCVRFIFEQFLAHGTYKGAERAASEAGLRSAIKYTRTGLQRGDRPLSSGMVYKVLNNPVYVGEIKGYERTYPGRHEPIIAREVWQAAEALRASREKAEPQWKQTDHFLHGLLWDSLGRRMLLSVDWDRGRPYHYYISSNAQWSQRQRRRQFRSHAGRLDKLVVSAVANFFLDREKLRAALKKLGVFGSDLERLVARGGFAANALENTPTQARRALFHALLCSVELGREELAIVFRSVELRRYLLWQGRSRFHGRPADWTWTDATYALVVSVRAVSAERSPVLDLAPRPRGNTREPNRKLVELLDLARRAQQMVEEQRDSTVVELARVMGCRPSHFARLVRLNYLAPDIITAILDGAQPESLGRRELITADLPLDWALQRKLFGFPETRWKPGDGSLGHQWAKEG